MPQAYSTSIPKAGRLKYPYMFRRIFYCGHPNEYIEVSKLSDQDRLVHTILPIDEYDRTAQRLEGKQVYTLERCQDCAMQYRTQQQASRTAARLRSMGAYQGEVLSHEQDIPMSKDGFGRVLTWLRDSGDRRPDRILYSRVDEVAYVQTSDMEEQTKAVSHISAVRTMGRAASPQASLPFTGMEESLLQLRGGGLEVLEAREELDVLMLNKCRQN